MKSLNKIFLLSLTVLALLLCVPQPSQTAPNKVIKIGCAISFTGSKSRSGKLYRDAYDLAVERINQQGGIKIGPDSYQLKIVYYDDQSEPTKSSRLVEKLITEDKVNFLIGPYSSGITIPDSIIAQRYRIPMIEGGGASGKIFSRGNKYIFGTLPPAGDYFSSTLLMLTTFNPRPKTVAILYADDKFDVSVAKGAKKKAKELGFNVVVYEKYAEGTTDFNSILTRVKAIKAEVVLVAGHTEESLNFVQQSKELNICPKLISLTVGPSERDFRESLGKDADYIYGVASWSPQMLFKGQIFKDTKEFTKIFKNKYGYDPDYHNASGIAVLVILKDAIERAGTLDPQKVRDAIAQTSLNTIYGHVQFSPNGQIKGTSVALQIQNGQIYQVFPGQIKPIYPIPCWNER